jgi:hypothetical protein
VRGFVLNALLSVSAWTGSAGASAPPFPVSARQESRVVVHASARPVALQLGWRPFASPSFNTGGPQFISSVLADSHMGVSQREVAAATPAQPRGYLTADTTGPDVSPFGLRARRLKRGQREQLRALLRLGVPVIVRQWLRPQWFVPQFRVVTGDDDRAGTCLALDPDDRPVVVMPSPVFRSLWPLNDAECVPVSPLSSAALVRVVLGA